MRNISRVTVHAAPLPITAYRPARRGWLTVVFLGLTAGLQMSDRGLYAVLSHEIEVAFGIGDTLLGALQGIAGILVASALAVPLARLGDRHSRKTILLSLIAAWSGLTTLGALAPNFTWFFVGRAASGVTEFAMIPIVYSLIPDVVPERARVPANLVFAALMAIGASIGFYLANDLFRFAAQQGVFGLPGWRGALLLLGLGGVPLLLLGFAIGDPVRAAVTLDSTGQSGSLAAFVRTRHRTIVLFLGTAGGLAIAVQATIPMAALALSRRYSADLGEIGHALGIITLVTALGSLPLAGAIDRALRNRFDERARPLIMGGAAALSIPFAILPIMAATGHMALWLLAGFILLTCIGNALIPTMLQDLAPIELRARCFAAYSFVIAIFCALGPVLSGAVSQFLTGGDLQRAIALAGVPALAVATLCAGYLAKVRPTDAENTTDLRSQSPGA